MLHVRDVDLENLRLVTPTSRNADRIVDEINL